jgi:hypothetical protein
LSLNYSTKSESSGISTERYISRYITGVEISQKESEMLGAVAEPLRVNGQLLKRLLRCNKLSLVTWLGLPVLILSVASKRKDSQPSSTMTALLATVGFLMLGAWLAFHVLLGRLAAMLNQSVLLWWLGALLFGPISATIACVLMHRAVSDRLSIS